MPRLMMQPPANDDSAASSMATSGTRGAQVIRPEAFRQDPRELLARVAAGEPLAQEELFDLHAKYVERLLFRLLGDDAEIADGLQDVFLGVFKNLGQLRDPRAFKGWLRAITVAVARKRIRSAQRKRWLRFLPSQELPEQAAIQPSDEVLGALQACYRVLDKLAPDLRIPFALRHIEQLELTTVADACDVSLATVKRRLKKAEGRFAQLAKREPELLDWMTEGSRWSAK